MKATIENTNSTDLPAKYRNINEDGRNKGMIVLFHEVDKGVVIESVPESSYEVGYYSDNWVGCTDPERWERVDETPKVSHHPFPALYRSLKNGEIVLAITETKGVFFTHEVPAIRLAEFPFTDTTAWERLPVGTKLSLENDC